MQRNMFAPPQYLSDIQVFFVRHPHDHKRTGTVHLFINDRTEDWIPALENNAPRPPTVCDEAPPMSDEDGFQYDWYAYRLTYGTGSQLCDNCVAGLATALTAARAAHAARAASSAP